MKTCTAFFILMATVMLVACDSGRHSGKGLRLPDGDIEAGKTAFVTLNCHTCHDVNGVEFPEVEATVPEMVALGGEIREVKTYGELVTSIINPSHEMPDEFVKAWEKAQAAFDGDETGDEPLSPMGAFNHIMTVEQMIDLVTFLDSRYKLLEPEYLNDHYGL